MNVITTMNPNCFKLIQAIFMLWLMLQVFHVCAEEVRCTQRERQALLDLKGDLVDDFGMLSSWGSEDCCEWKGVYCSTNNLTVTGHILMLDLNGANPDPNVPLVSIRQSLKGKINKSLMELQYLMYLNLSWNDFQGTHIPEFFGSLRNLAYLDLSRSYFSGKVPNQLGSLSHLQYLNLQFNQLEGSIPYHLGNLSKLQYLSLCDNPLVGAIPSQLGKLSSLQVLCLGRYHECVGALKLDNGNLAGGQWLSNLTSLTYLALSEVRNLKNSHNWLQMIGKLPNLRELGLSGCGLSDNFIHSLGPSKFNFSSSLAVFDLSDNTFASSLVFQWISNVSSSLVLLDLENNLLEGPISNDFGTSMISLDQLYLDSNRLEGKDLKPLVNICTLRALWITRNNLIEELPTILQNLSAGCVRHSLQVLELTLNKITGTLPDLSTWESLKALGLEGNRLSGKIPEGSMLPSQLEYLSMGSNSFEGGIPKSFGNACSLSSLRLPNNSLSEELPVIIHHLSGCARYSLQELYLGNNQINGTLPDLSIFPFLKVLRLSQNRLNGKINAGFRLPSQLKVLDLISNSIRGVITDSHFANTSKLKALFLSDNLLALTVRENWVPSFQLDEILLRSCKLGPAFPKWLQTQNNLVSLDISNAEISDIVPEWFWVKLTFPRQLDVNISYNNLKGTIPNLPLRLIQNSLTFSSNQFEGPIPPFLRDAMFLDLSNNRFSDSLLFLCANGTVETLGNLILSNNQLSGPIPDCWSRFKSLASLDLGHNNFSGKIPTSMGSLLKLQALILRNNSLTEEIPFSLRSCTNLVILDVGENRLSGPIPSWIGSRLQQLLMVSLQRNHFFGTLPLHLCYLTSIQLLDLSLNSLRGPIPKCFKNFTSMAQMTSPSDYLLQYGINNHGLITVSSYDLMASLMWKGAERIFNNKKLLLKGIDLSSNQFSGEVPVEITNLFELVSLNLSRNNLTGEIPSMIGRLTSLEFLDLSRNQLFGLIPPSLAQIDRLTMLDLSHNHLSGEIPTSTQLQSFNASSYEDNLDLCGRPLQKMCEVESQEPIVKFHEDEDSHFARAFHISMPLGFVTGFWVIFGSILVKRSWRHAYFRFLNNLSDNIYVMIAVKVANYKRWLKG